MSIIDNLKEDLAKDAKTAEATLTTESGRKWVKYAVFGVIGLILLGMGSCMLRGCSGPTPVPTLANGSVPMQPQVIQQNSGAGTSDMIVAAGLGYVVGQMMSNGQRYDGHNAPTTIVNNRTYYIRADGKQVEKPAPMPVATPVAPTPAPVAKVLTPAEQKSLDQKAVKASADKVAEAEKVKMKAEADKKVAEETRKNELKAKLAASKSAPAKTGGFSSFSKSVTTRSTTSSYSSKRK